MNILITGTSSGFGLLTVRTLAAKGHTVFASMRGVEGKNAAVAAEIRASAERDGQKIHVIELDVTDQASVDRAVGRILERDGHLDVVVNNAGVAGVGLTEAYTIEQVQQMFDVNLIGVQRVNRAVLPSMRKRGSGLLVHISSVIGRWLMPVMGVYCATKFALEALAEAYRYDLALIGVDSVIVEPGTFPTEILGKVVQAADADRTAGYGDASKLPEQVGAALHASLANPPSPQLVADAIAKLVDTPAGKRPLRTVVDPMSGQAAETINATAAEVQAGIMNAMGMGALLQPKV